MGIYCAFKIFIINMKDLIRKILKEESDDLEWVTGLDVDAAHQETFKPFKNLDSEFGIDGQEIFDMLVESGIHTPSHLIEIAKHLNDQFQQVNDQGYDSGRDNCDCDGCCDDYYYEDQVNEMTSDARQEGREERDDEINDLQVRIDELEGELEDLRSRLGE